MFWAAALSRRCQPSQSGAVVEICGDEMVVDTLDMSLAIIALRWQPDLASWDVFRQRANGDYGDHLKSGTSTRLTTTGMNPDQIDQIELVTDQTITD